MTRNEYIASIMLEAADLLRENNEVDVLDETSLNPYDCLCALYEQACDMSLNEDASDNLWLLSEAADEIPKNDEEIKQALIKGDVNKITKVVNKVAKWYYKVEPNKKFKLLHSVLKFLNSVLYQCYSKLGGGLSNRLVYDEKVKNKKAAAFFIVVANAVSNVIHNIVLFAILKTFSDNLAQTGDIGAQMMGSALDRSAQTLKSGRISGAVKTAVGSTGGIAAPGLYAKGQYEYNIKDFDKNLKLLKDGREKLVKANNPNLKKAISNYDKAIAQLQKEKAKYEKLKASKISARGAAIRSNESGKL